ncbi:MAG: PucR family transcriptional regulator [Jatrophihabitantaceae bacterium]
MVHPPFAPPDDAVLAADGESLTLGRLLLERLMRSNSAPLDAGQRARLVDWCTPWEQAMQHDGTLTGLLVHARPDQLDPAGLRSLAERDAAALVVAGPTDEPLSCALPVVALTARVSYHELSHLVAELTLAREAHVLRYGSAVHRSLVELMYRGAGIAALCNQMARLSGCAAAILDPQYRLLAFEQSRDRVLEPGALAAALRSSDRPDAEADADADDGLRRSPQVTAVRVDGMTLTCVINAIVLGGRHDGWVVVVESDDPPHPHDIAEHLVVVDQSATIVGTEMLRMRSVEQAEERARGDFVHALLHGRFATAHDLEARAAHYDFPVAATFGVVVAGSMAASGGTDSVNKMFQLAREATRLMPHAGIHTLATVVGDVLAVIRQVEVPDRAGSPEAASLALADYAHALEQELSRRVGAPVPVVWGRPVQNADRIFDSYRDARLTLGLHSRLGMQDACGFSDLRVYAVLAELAGSEHARAFAHDVLAPLRAQRSGANDLEQAVITYVELSGNLNAAARQMHIHRNTMLYKLERASRILHLDLRQAEHQFTVWLAYKLDLLFETARKVDRDVKPA